MSIGQKLKALRTLCGFTQEELADRCELTKGYISQLENDLTSPSISTLTDILVALGTDLKTFFSDEEEVITFKENDYFILTGDSDTYYAKSVILATGVKHRDLGLENEENLIGNGISYCATCDGPFFKGQDVAVIGDGNSALQYTLALSTYCKKVYICTLFDFFVGDQQLVNRIKELPNIEIIHNVSLKEYIGEDILKGLKFENTITKETLTLDVEGVFIAIGQVPNNQAFKDLVDLDEQGYFLTNETCTTKTEGLFVAGDCRQKKVRQVTTAVSDGAIAATLSVEYLNRK